MKRMHLKILFILFSILVLFLSYMIYAGRNQANMPAMNRLEIDTSSTRDWQNTAEQYINKRNNIINGVSDGRYKSIGDCEAELKTVECPSILDGDVSLISSLLKNPGRYKEKMSNIVIEYCEVRKLTKEEVIITAKLVYEKESMPVRCDYEIAFENKNGKWLLSKLAFAE